jgi:hypothetical protein
MFKKLPGNRGVNIGHVQQLISSIQNENLLKARPILVNENLEIVDGQHRLEAAKILQVPIFYEVVEGLAIKDVARVNSYQKNWRLESFLDLYCDHVKDENYLKLRDWIQSNSFSISQGIAFFIDEMNVNEFREKFKSGQFAYDPKKAKIGDSFQIMLNKLKTFYRGVFRPWENQGFVRAFCMFIVNPEIEEKRLWEQIDKYPFLLSPRATKQGMLDLLYEIYNYRRHSKVEV